MAPTAIYNQPPPNPIKKDEGDGMIIRSTQSADGVKPELSTTKSVAQADKSSIHIGTNRDRNGSKAKEEMMLTSESLEDVARLKEDISKSITVLNELKKAIKEVKSKDEAGRTKDGEIAEKAVAERVAKTASDEDETAELQSKMRAEIEAKAEKSIAMQAEKDAKVKSRVAGEQSTYVLKQSSDASSTENSELKVNSNKNLLIQDDGGSEDRVLKNEKREVVQKHERYETRPEPEPRAELKDVVDRMRIDERQSRAVKQRATERDVEQKRIDHENTVQKKEIKEKNQETEPIKADKSSASYDIGEIGAARKEVEKVKIAHSKNIEMVTNSIKEAEDRTGSVKEVARTPSTEKLVDRVLEELNMQKKGLEATEGWLKKTETGWKGDIRREEQDVDTAVKDLVSKISQSPTGMTRAHSNIESEVVAELLR